jgi:predicted nuclease of restriction endonuclease-like (RecB) superfamily
VDRAPLAISGQNLRLLDDAVYRTRLSGRRPPCNVIHAMARSRNKLTKQSNNVELQGYDTLLVDIAHVIEEARHGVARSVNVAMTTSYWLIGRCIVEQEQQGVARAAYGEQLLKRLSRDLSKRFGRGFSERNLEQMRGFYLGWPISQTAPAESSTGPRAPQISQTASAKSVDVSRPVQPRFPLPWSHYVRLLGVESAHARTFYETEALRGGWTNRQLDRQIQSQFYERTALSRNKAAMLRKGHGARADDAVTAEEKIKDPYVLEFLDLKDEYSESDLESALVARLETFLLELGDDFAFVGRQRRLRLDDEWYRVDLVFFHRLLRCLVVIDLKLGKFTHADAGQMHLYLNYAREHWTRPGENPPVGLVLCTKAGEAVAHYAIEGLPNKILAAEYRTTLPDEETIAAELERTRAALEKRAAPPREPSWRKRRRPARDRER